MKLIIDIPELDYECAKQRWMSGNDPHKMDYYISNGTPLDDVKDIIRDKKAAETDIAREYYNLGLGDAINILDYVGKAESRE